MEAILGILVVIELAVIIAQRLTAWDMAREMNCLREANARLVMR